jgi:hypothetical protein
LKEQNISWKTLDEKSIFPILLTRIKENNITQTPTCVIRYSARDIKIFVGDVEILNGLNALKTHISTEKK